ncbi:uncharacterized protein V1510DRAFT_423773 [Dipodascopsis tothii]|uniref:uncharacterized protein n=1 Tax=Dipodascopsis tothii TaxID=44089 RepID=UPI0034CE3D63
MRPPSFVLFDYSADMVAAWRAAVAALPSTLPLPEIRQGDLIEHSVAFDCVVSPGNSFGRLEGGLDAVIARAVSPAPHDAADIAESIRLLRAIHMDCSAGFQTPGSCYIMDLTAVGRLRSAGVGSAGFRYIAHTPTMIVPAVLAGEARKTPYFCTYAVLAAVRRFNATVAPDNAIRSVAISGLGTGVGGLSPDVCARLMVLAWRHFHESLNGLRNDDDWDKMTAWTEEIDAALL